MAQDQTSLYNLALSSIGTRESVSSPTEESREAEICNLWFTYVRDFILRAAPWPSARAHARLSLLAERDTSVSWTATDPDPGFKFAYAAPADMINPRYITTFERFVLSTHDGGTGRRQAIMSNVEDVILAYTMRQINLSLWDSQLYFAVAHALAATIAMPLHGKAERAKVSQDRANQIVLEARQSGANADEDTYDFAASWHQARGYGQSAPIQRFIYPDGPLFTVESLPSVT